MNNGFSGFGAGGEGDSSVSALYIKDVQFNLPSVSELSSIQSKFSREGYTFNVWCDADNPEQTYTDNQLVSFNADEVNLCALWTINKYTVSWQTPEGGSIEVKKGQTAIASGSKVDYKTILTITATPDIGYKLESLTVNGEAFTSGNTYEVGTSDVTIAASFVENTGTITYWPGY